jgi:hypothetical protein
MKTPGFFEMALAIVIIFVFGVLVFWVASMTIERKTCFQLYQTYECPKPIVIQIKVGLQ